MDTIVAFTGLAIVIVVTPGPDLMLVTRSVLNRGARAGLLTAFGVASGSAAWALASAAGLVALIAASPDVLTIIRWLGAGYLAWMGLRSLFGRGPKLAPQDAFSPPTGGRSEPYRAGLISNLLHPGQVVFYASMLPQFIDSAGDSLQPLRLGAIFVAVALAWFSAYALVASRLRLHDWSRLWPAMTRITGIALLGFAFRLAARV